MFEITLLICDRFKTLDPISIREKDAEEVILLMARFISLNNNKQTSNKQTSYQASNVGSKRKRKKVYADTATGGWY